MPNRNIDRDKPFFKNLPADFALGEDPAQQRLFREYGAIFVARGGIVAPSKVVFRDAAEVNEFQSKLDISRRDIGSFSLELQSVAMDALLAAVAEAAHSGLSITPRGADSARRNYEDTIGLWKSRVDPALEHWVNRGNLSNDKADMIRSLSPFEQVPEIFGLEEGGIFFAKDLSKSIIYSVAPPGASQHLSLLAFDVSEFNDPAVREILARHYWYQTVVSDLPHFTFLGVRREELYELGLQCVENGGREFWLPDV
jgi:hypothetical protein